MVGTLGPVIVIECANSNCNFVFWLCFDLAGCTTAMMDKQCTFLHIATMATFLPKWKVVAKLLGLEGQIIRDIEDGYPNGEDQRSEALMKWVGMKGPQATYRKIYDILCDLEEMEAAEKVKELTSGVSVWVHVCVHVPK